MLTQQQSLFQQVEQELVQEQQKVEQLSRIRLQLEDRIARCEDDCADQLGKVAEEREHREQSDRLRSQVRAGSPSRLSYVARCSLTPCHSWSTT